MTKRSAFAAFATISCGRKAACLAAVARARSMPPVFALAALLATAGPFGGPVHAQGDAAGVRPASDSDGDGLYSYPELRSVYPHVDEESFTEIDRSGDGLVDEEELRSAARAGLLLPN